MTDLSERAKQFLAKNPTEIGRVLNVTYYEDPVYGDEAPLIEMSNGNIRRSDFWELPDIFDL